MRAISVFSLDAGTSTVGCRAASALRRRVNISAMGSLNIRYPRLPACLDHAGNLAVQRELAEAQTAQREFAQIAPRPSAAPAAVAMAAFVLRRLLIFGDFR